MIYYIERTSQYQKTEITRIGKGGAILSAKGELKETDKVAKAKYAQTVNSASSFAVVRLYVGLNDNRDTWQVIKESMGKKIGAKGKL